MTHASTPTTVLISGASIAGPALAFWLGARGFRPTVVERHPGPRPGGQAIDVRGTALAVIERMGLSDQVRAASTQMRGMSFVDRQGHVLMSTTEATLTGGRTDSGDVELMRDDLAAILLAATRDVDYLYDDSITTLAQQDDGVDVTFEHAAPARFDLVIGADGLHSQVRALAFGPEDAFVRHLGIYLAVFTVPNDFGLDHWQTFYRLPDGMVGVYSARDNREARAILGFASPPIGIDHRDVAGQRALLQARFADVGWRTEDILAAMHDAADFHCDAMAQVIMPAWSSGRVALVGDAAWCGSPLSGQGTSTALVGAYVLAEELARAPHDPTRAFAAYRARLEPFIQQNQALALRDREAPPEPEVLQAAANALTLDAA